MIGQGRRAAARRWSRWSAVGALLLVVLVGWWPAGGGIGHAGRFGPPWQGEVAVDSTPAYADPGTGNPVGPLMRGDIVAVLEEVRGGDGRNYARTPVGYVPLRDLAERTAP